MSSDSARTFYLTTPIYYVNGAPHLGSAYTTIVADTLARTMRMDGRDTFFLTGLDEHGQKVAQAASEAGLKPQDWVDSMAQEFKRIWAELGITYDDFIRTTEERHMTGVMQLFSRLYESGAIYMDTYRGHYCVPDETFFTDEQLSDFAAVRMNEGLSAVDETGAPLCPDCVRPLIYMEEENLFFRLSDYTQPLLDFYEQNPGFIQPDFRRNEVISFVRGGLKDLSVSRTAFDWGVPVPFAPGHISYVWIDALINYLTGIGFGSTDPADAALFAKYWPAQVHLIAKDIIRFHCVIWPAVLMAAGLPLPEKVFVHGYLLTKGIKMSKSRGNTMAPSFLTEKFSLDGYRYFFLTDIQLGADSSVSLERILQVYNADLANSWGNLCSRVFNMTEKYLDGQVPELWEKTVAALTREMNNPLADIAEGLYEPYIQAIQEMDFTAAFAHVMGLVDRANLYLEESAPWALARAATEEAAAAEAAGISLDQATAPTAADRLAFVLYNSLEAIRIIALYFAPVMPGSSCEVWQRLGLDGLDTVADLRAVAQWGKLPAGNRVVIGEPLFPRLSEADLDLDHE
ncbi:MAG: methionine--tRNA ligase [Coriobacteriales bacterium]|jgi:methionyl-tRNA synthetase|nr:methionine--tRNA ligase [Coriobacteriales bacterium]